MALINLPGYTETGDNAQPEVQEAILRWAKLPATERAKKPLLYWLLGSGTPPYKIPKSIARYVDRSGIPGQTCGNCEFQYLKTANKKYICSQIRGAIKPPGWCIYWLKGK